MRDRLRRYDGSQGFKRKGRVVKNEDKVSSLADFSQSNGEKARSDIHFGALEAPKQARSFVRPSEGLVSNDSQKVGLGVESEISEPEKASETVVFEPAAEKIHEHDGEIRTVYQEVASRWCVPVAAKC